MLVLPGSVDLNYVLLSRFLMRLKSKIAMMMMMVITTAMMMRMMTMMKILPVDIQPSEVDHHGSAVSNYAPNPPFNNNYYNKKQKTQKKEKIEKLKE